MNTRSLLERGMGGGAPAYLDLHFHSWREAFWNDDGVSFPPRESQGVCSLPREVFEGNHPHSHQVTAVNALVALSQDSFDSLRSQDSTLDIVSIFFRYTET